MSKAEPHICSHYGDLVATEEDRQNLTLFEKFCSQSVQLASKNGDP